MKQAPCIKPTCEQCDPCNLISHSKAYKRIHDDHLITTASRMNQLICNGKLFVKPKTPENPDEPGHYHVDFLNYGIEVEPVSMLDDQLNFEHLQNHCESLERAHQSLMNEIAFQIAQSVCECGTEKHGFASHSTWCAKYEENK